MKKIKFAIAIFAIIAAAFAIFFALNSHNALVMHPKGVIARDELHLIKTNIFLMLIVVIPTIVLLFYVAWKYRAKNKAKYDSEHTGSVFSEVILWIIPTIVIAVMATITYKATHKLDPYRPLDSAIKPLTIQVVALNWKWLFIYPEQGIATLNFVQFPAGTPIHLELTADASPMNSFWIPQLSGQIYAMTGMTTQLHIMADAPGVYTGRAAEINGKGLADMTFVAKSTSQSDFDAWIIAVKQSPLQLSAPVYDALIAPSVNDPVQLYSNVEKGLFKTIQMKYMEKK